MKPLEKKVFLVADTHFNHKKIIEYGRPQDFEFRLMKNLSELNETDILIHLGDICIGKDRDVHRIAIRSLRCKKILVRGNHDNKGTLWYLNNGWDMVVDGFVMSYKGKRILFTHIPKEYSSKYDMNIHGHIHTFEREDNESGNNRMLELDFEYYDKYHKLISSEYNDYKPVLLDTYV